MNTDIGLKIANGFAMLPALILLSLCAVVLGWALSINTGNTQVRAGAALTLAHRSQLQAWVEQATEYDSLCWSPSCYDASCSTGCLMGYWNTDSTSCIADVQVISRQTAGWHEVDISSYQSLMPEPVRSLAAKTGLMRTDWYCPTSSATEVRARLRVTYLIEDSQTWGEQWLIRSVPLP